MRITRLAGLVAAGALALTASLPVAAADDAMVRVLHGSPDAPSVDVFVNDGKVDALSGLVFGKITDYVKVPAGTYAVKVCATADNNLCPIGPVDLTFEAGKKYTVAASDLLAQIKADLIPDGNAKLGEARVRAVHLSADTPNVDVRPDGGDPVLTDLPYRSASDYLPLPGGAYDLEVCATGTDTCPLDLPEVTVKEGTAYSVFAVGQLAPTGEQQALTYVLAVDGVAAPATDTETTNSSAWMLVLAGAGLLGLVASRRFATARAAK